MSFRGKDVSGVSIDDILAFLEAEGNDIAFFGDEADVIAGFSNLSELEPQTVIWIKNDTYINEELKTRLTPDKGLLVIAPLVIDGVNCIVTDYPKGVFFSLINHFFAPKQPASCISNTACVLTKDIAEGVSVGANCFIGENVSIGERTVIHPGVSIICPCTIGCDCEIYPGVVIGADGFGYYIDGQGVPHREIHHRGVVIGDRVEIGANTCIDRGLLTDTVIEDDVKIDNLCHIAHNVIIRKCSMIIASSVICGSTQLAERSYVAPNSAILEQTQIGQGAKVGIGSVVLRDVSENEEVFGNPARVMGKKSE